MIETDMQAYVLTCYRFYGYVKEENLVKNIPKIQTLAPLNPSLDLFNDYLLSYMIETDMPAYVLTCFRFYGYVKEENLVKNIPKILTLSPLNPEYPIWR